MNTARTYRERPKVVEAVVWDGDPMTARHFMGEAGGIWAYADGSRTAIDVQTSDGAETAVIGSYLIKYPSGTFGVGHARVFPYLFKEVD